MRPIYLRTSKRHDIYSEFKPDGVSTHSMIRCMDCREPKAVDDLDACSCGGYMRAMVNSNGVAIGFCSPTTAKKIADNAVKERR